MKLIAALLAFLGVASIAAAVPAAAEGGSIVARDANPDERGSIVEVTERSLEARIDIPPGIHVIAANSTSGIHDLATASYNNPFHIGVNVGEPVVLSVVAYAAYWQVVTFGGVPGAGGNVVFSGSGEGLPMNYNSLPYYVIPGQADGYLLTVLFQYSTSGAGGALSNAAINNLPAPISAPQETLIYITSEDGTDNDNNDSDATIAIRT